MTHLIRKLSASGDEMVRQIEGWWKRQMDEHEVARTECKCGRKICYVPQNITVA